MNSKHITNYKPKDFAELLGVSVKTLQRWNRENILKAKRTQLIEDIIPMTRVFRV